jgi:hypothetical protein
MNQPICIEIPALPDPQQLTLPGGVQIEHLSLMQIVQPALTPLVPLFDLVDAIVAVFHCVKAIPDALGPPPDPTVLAACLPDLAKKVDKLLRLVPQLSLPILPILVVQLVDLVADTVRQARSALLHLQEQANQMVLVVARAAELNDPGLMAIGQCAQANLAQEAANVGKSLAALGKLIGLINLFLGMLGGPQVPDVAQLSGQPLESAVAELDSLLATLTTVRGMLPAP